ncbi:MAG TPA: FtsX-like permease family protein, partial [Ilumatobacteraceae bacterium]|nr:FtsX-like permease family protein [Ilumatobacteraceae bacterium]
RGQRSAAVRRLSTVWQVGWFRFRVSLRRDLGGYVGLVVLIALIGGVAMASVAGARRTQSSYPAFMTSTNPSDLTISYFDGVAPPELIDAIANLPNVRRITSMVALAGLPLAADGTPLMEAIPEIGVYASVDGLMSQVDRPTLLRGRLADPTKADEVMMTDAATKVMGLHLGQTVPFGFYGPDQVNSPSFGTAGVQPALRIAAKLVGIVAINNQIVQDDVDRFPATVLFTTALAHAAAKNAINTIFGLQLKHGSRDVAATQQAFINVLPGPLNYGFHFTARIEAQVERTVKPEAIALAVFGLIATIVVLLVAVQAISRRLQARSEDRFVLAALGAEPAMVASDGLVGVLIAVLAGSLLAGATAVALSQLAPLGPVRKVYPSAGIDFDWTVLSIGLFLLIVGISAGALVLAISSGPRHGRGVESSGTRSSRLGRMSSWSWLPPSGVVGVRFATDPGPRRGGAQTRSTFAGFILAALLVVATLTFGSGLQKLVSHPSLYGWNWTYALFPTRRVPPPTGVLLSSDPDVESWSGVGVASVEIDGQPFPALIATPNAEPAPPLLTGHGLAADDEIVLGVTTLAQLHKKVGDLVEVSYGTPRQAPFYVPPTKVVIVGTATMPAIGWPSLNAEHTSMGTGAYLSSGLEPDALKQAQLSQDPIENGPDLIFVRLRKTVGAARGAADMQRIVNATNAALADDPAGGSGNTVRALGTQHPAEIVNYRSIGSTPAILAGALAIGALIALDLALVASVRRRRTDLALLKVLGFTNGQLSAAVAWQASVAAIGGIVVGVPLGIVVGRQLWIQFAHSIAAVAEPTVPVVATTLVAVGALLFSNLVAALPARSAARTKPGILLSEE